MNTFSIIMPVWIIDFELLKLTQATMNSIKNSDDYDKIQEFILIDNGSPVGTNYLIGESDIYLRGLMNRVYPWGVNQGLKIATSDFLVISNNDIRISPNWINITEAIFEEDEKVGSVHFRMIDYDTPMDLGNETWITGKERWCSSSFFVIRKKAVPEGLYDENYGWGSFDDWDLQHRLRHIDDWKSAYTNKAIYQHKHSSTQSKLGAETWRKQSERNREYFKTKFGKYPEEIWEERYPDQMKLSYLPLP